MEDTYPTRCIVLDRKAFRENDLRVVLFSCDKGRLDLVARGAKKITSKVAGHIEPFSKVKAMIVKGSHFNYLGSAVSENSFYKIKQDYLKSNLIGEVNKVILRTLQGSEKSDASKIFNLIEEYLIYISGVNEDDLNQYYYFYYNIFVLKFLELIGYCPNLYSCIDCSKKIKEESKKVFNITKGGVGCCLGENNLDQYLVAGNNEIKVLRFIISSEFKGINDLKISIDLVKKVNNIINRYYLYLFE